MGDAPSRPGAHRGPGEVAWCRHGERIAVGRVPAPSSRPFVFCGAAIAGMIGLAMVPGAGDRERARKDAGLLGQQPEMILALAFSPDGRRLAASGYEGPVRIWDVGRRSLEAILEVEAGPAYGLAWSPDGKALAAAGMRQAVTIWDSDSWERAAVLEGGPGLARSLAWSPDGASLATGGIDSLIAVWDVGTWERRAVLRGHTGSINAMAFSADGRSLTSSGSDGRIGVWDIASGRPARMCRFPTGALTDTTLSASGAALAILDYRAVVRRDADGVETPAFRGKGPYLGLACSPGDHLLAMGMDGGPVELRRASPAGPPTTLRAHTAAVRALAFSPDGRTLATGDRTGVLRTWDVGASLDGNADADLGRTPAPTATPSAD